jgi:hypothetical protein
MIIKGIEVTKFRWNDKEVSEEEYLRLDEEWRKLSEASEPPEKKSPTKRTKK